MAEPKDDVSRLVAAIDAALDEEFEARLRAELAARDRDWLVEALVRHVVRERHLAQTPHRRLARQAPQVEPVAQRRERLRRLEALGLDEAKVRGTVERFGAFTRETLVAERFLLDPPHKGKEALGPAHRSAAGEALLEEAHDLFYALLFCDTQQGVQLPRTRRDFLTVTMPSLKAPLLERFMLAVTETPASGTWLDPEGVSDDIGARNTILQVEFGDGPDGLVSGALMKVLELINELEVNEEILYARIEKLEGSTLVD